MQVQVLEDRDYSHQALALYARLGQLHRGCIAARQQAEIGLLVIRLGQMIDQDFLAQYPALQAIATPTTGLTHLDLSVCRQRGLRVFSLADCRQAIGAIRSTSELAFGLILALLRNIPAAHHDVVHEQAWSRERFKSRQLQGLTLGLIGFGRIGQQMAAPAQAFGMQVLAHDPAITSAEVPAGVRAVSLEALLQSSDIVSLHADLNDSNHGLIGKTALATMQPTALLINTARGELLDENAVAKALIKQRLAGVAVDVLCHEQQVERRSQSPLLAAAREGHNVLITPHIGGCTLDAMQATELALAETVLKALRGAEAST